MTISRNPDDYYPSDHATIRAKERGIDWPVVVNVIEQGEIKDSHKEDCVLFVDEYSFTPDPVGVVADYTDGEIITVEYRND